MLTHNSINNPLIITTVTAPCGGVVGMTIFPGKIQHATSGYFQRDLNQDLDLIKDWGAAAVVTLIPQSELNTLQVGNLGAAVEERDMLWLHLPITEAAVPDTHFERDWLYSGLRLRQLLRMGKRILIHCRGGLGRTGLLTARLLVELGLPSQEAVAQVRQARPGAIQTAAQERYVYGIQIANNDDWLDRLLGCLLGGAVGDAFGYAIEFDPLSEIQRRFGPKGMTRPQYQQDKFVVSDDTQMTLFTLEGLLHCTDSQGKVNPTEALKHIRLAYLDWWDTQQSDTPTEILAGQLAKSPAMRVTRAPGQTCLTALAEGCKGTLSKPVNHSKGCGGVMRIAPVGFLNLTDPFELAAGAASLTHGHPDGWGPAGILARIIRNLIRGERKFLAVRNSFSDASEWGHVFGVMPRTDLYSLAMEFGSRMRHNPKQAIHRLGQGWVGDEALAIAIYCFLSARNFQDLIVRAANHDGDSDSTASIAGQLWGAARGIAEVPHAWIRRLDVLEDILGLAAKAKAWPTDVDSVKETFTSAQPSADLLPCVRMMEMTHELHILGYQRIRVFPYFSPSGCYWRLEWAPVGQFTHPLRPPRDNNDLLIARYTSGDGWNPFEWEDVEPLSPLEMAHLFIRQFPELVRAGEGDDWSYAGWLTALLGRVRQGHLPYFLADWSFDSQYGVPMSKGDFFPLPPACEDICEYVDEDGTPENDEDWGDNEDWEEIDNEEYDLTDNAAWNEHCELVIEEMDPVIANLAPSIQAQFDTACIPAEASATEYPPPSYFDFSDVVYRAHGLVAFYHHGNSHLLQTTQLLWEQLPEPRAINSTRFCQQLGITGQGKKGLLQLMSRFLKQADDACTKVVTERARYTSDGAIDWAAIQEEFHQMDKTLLDFSWTFSLVFERFVQGEARE